MSKAQELEAELQRYGVVTMNRWATDGATLLRTQDALLRQALEALEAMQSYANAERKGLLICDETIEAIKEHLK